MVWVALLLLGALSVGAQRDCYGSVVSNMHLMINRRACRSHKILTKRTRPFCRSRLLFCQETLRLLMPCMAILDHLA